MFFGNLKKAIALLKLPSDLIRALRPKQLAMVVHTAYAYIQNALILCEKKIAVGCTVAINAEWLKERYVVGTITGDYRIRLKTAGGDWLSGSHSPGSLKLVA